MSKYQSFLKVIQNNSRIPILGTVLVRDGKAHATDMDMQVSVPCDLPPGLYYKNGFGKFNLPCDLPVDDFPFFDRKGDCISVWCLEPKHIEALKWVAMAQSKDATRYYLNGTFFEKSGTVVATDGHRLHSFITGPEVVERASICNETIYNKWAGSIIPSKAIKIILDIVKEYKAQEIVLMIRENELFTALCAGGVEIHGRTIDGSFPNWRAVVPNFDEKEFGTAAFDQAEVKAILPKISAMGSVSKFHKTKSVKVTKGKIEYSNSLLGNAEFETSINWPCEIGFNVRYLAEMCSGQMYYNPACNTDPVKVIDRRGGVEKLGVLMPMRV